MSKWDPYKPYQPEPAEEWRMPRTRAEIVTEMDLCSIPLDATPAQACCLLETNGTWVPRVKVADALRYRRTCVVSAVSGQDT